MIRIYVGSYKGYNEGIIDGCWHTLPEADIWDRIYNSCVSGAEEFAIFDYEADFQIDELDSIDELNELAKQLEGLTENEEIIMTALLDRGFSHNDALYHLDDCTLWAGMNMADIAEEYITSCYDLERLGTLANYIDYEAFGRDLNHEGRFLETDNGIVEFCF